MHTEVPFIVKLVVSLSVSSHGTTRFRSTDEGSQLSILLIGTRHSLSDATSIIQQWTLMQGMHSSSDDMDIDSTDQSSTSWQSLWQSLDKASSSTHLTILDAGAPLADSVFNGEHLLLTLGGRRSDKTVSCVIATSFHPRPLDFKQANFPQISKVQSKLEYSLHVLRKRKGRTEREHQAGIQAEIDDEDYQPTAKRQFSTGLDGDLAMWHPYSIPVVMS